MTMAEQDYGIDQGKQEPNPDFTKQHAPVGQPPEQDPPKEREIDPVQAREEQPVQVSQQEEEKEQEDVVDVLVPKAEVKVWKFGPPGMQREYVQRPLSFIAKMQWFALVGEVMDKAMSGDDRLSLNSLFSAPTGRGSNLSVTDFRDADTFVHAVGKLLVHAPDFLIKSYLIWLNVPDYDRDLAKDLMESPPDEGGLSDRDGMEIIEIFIDQNYDALNDFFQEEVGRLRDRLQARAKEASERRSARSKR